MRKDIIILLAVVILIIFSIVQTVQVFNLKKTFSEIMKTSSSSDIEENQLLNNVQKNSKQDVPESLREVPTVVQGCFS
ncbi:MAG TPA: hypothetical protein VJH20_02465 [Candidatus Nanoarchaeia archaeon]|nr:hypothetical protein [Candidatus Nanoarchaeia archaeon]